MFGDSLLLSRPPRCCHSCTPSTRCSSRATTCWMRSTRTWRNWLLRWAQRLNLHPACTPPAGMCLFPQLELVWSVFELLTRASCIIYPLNFRLMIETFTLLLYLFAIKSFLSTCASLVTHEKRLHYSCLVHMLLWDTLFVTAGWLLQENQESMLHYCIHPQTLT